MANLGCHAPTETPRDRAKALILKTWGVHRVAGWLGVTEHAVYQGLGRATDENPVPPAWIPKILEGAKADQLPLPLAVISPALAGAVQ